MDQSLRSLFDQALDDEPDAEPVDTVRAAMARGRRIRRRRRLTLGGSIAAVLAAAVLAVNLLPAHSPPPTRVSPAAMVYASARPGCVWPVRDQASDGSIFLRTTATAAQRSALDQALRADRRVVGLTFVSRATAYQRFTELWKSDPEFVKSVSPTTLPEYFEFRLADPAGFDAIARSYEGRAGVQVVVGRNCPGGTE